MKKKAWNEGDSGSKRCLWISALHPYRAGLGHYGQNLAFRNGLPLLDNHSSLLLLLTGWLSSCLVSWQAGINTGTSIKSKLNKRIIAHLSIELCIGLTPLVLCFVSVQNYCKSLQVPHGPYETVSQILNGLACTGIPLLPGSQHLPPFIIIFIFTALPKVCRSWAATISTPSSKCSLIHQLCLLCTFRHYSFSPGSEPCKLRQSPSTHTQNSWKPELPDFNIRSMQGVGEITHRLPSSLCPFLHYKEDKCCDLLFWHSFDEDCVSAIRSTRKSFVRRSDQVW